MISRRGLLAFAGTSVLAAGCARNGRSTWERARASGAVRIGISGEEPYSYLDASGQLTGESPEVARAVLAGLRVRTLEAVQRPFGELVPALLDGAFDIAAAGMAITPDHCGRVAFAGPDLVAPTALLVRRGNPRRLWTFDDVAMAGVRIAVLDGAVEQGFARAAGALTDISLRALLSRHPMSGLEVTPGLARSVGGGPAPLPGGFAFRPGDTDLRDAFGAGLRSLQASGEWLRIVEPFGVAAANLPPPDLTAADLCRTA